MRVRPRRPRLHEALALASGGSPAACAELLARDGQGAYILLYELGVDRVEPGTLARTVLVRFPSSEGPALWARCVAAGLCADDPRRSFACGTCDGHGRARDDGPDDHRFVTCPACAGARVRREPARVTDVLSLAGDWERVVAFDRAIPGDVAWRVRRGDERVDPADAGAGPRYRVDGREPARTWLSYPVV